ncbi:MAG: penicillin-binding protein [Polyangiaceae bacterium]|nr:penicillin-binding protein [Polyangiaceae bacterium]
MRRWIGLAVAGCVLVVAPLVARTLGVGRGGDEQGEELAKVSQKGFTKDVDPPALSGVDPTRPRYEEDGVYAPAHGERTAKLTLDKGLQQLAERVVKQAEIPEVAVVLQDTRTGRILVYESQTRPGKARDLVVEAEAPAASIFKIVTGSALVEHARLTPETKQCYWGGEHRLEAANLEDNPKKDKWCATISEAMGRSLNTVFARLALKHLDQAKLGQTAARLGFGDPVPFDVTVAPSTIQLPQDRVGFARTSAGFWNTTLSPLGAVTLATTMANRGQTLRPVVVDWVKEGRETLHKGPSRQVLGRAVAPEVAAAVTRMMEATVRDGTSFKAFHDGAGREYLPGITVAGKTGTLTKQQTDQFFTWFVGFAPSQKPEVAIAVLAINKATWKTKANTVARQMLQGYFAEKGAAGVKPPI